MNALETILNNETRSEASFEKKSSMYQKLVRGVASTSIALAAFLGSGTAADMITPTSAYAEESQLNIPSLNEGNYRQVINSEPVCVIMYYDSAANKRNEEIKQLTGHTPQQLGDNLMKELRKVLPSQVNFYKVNIVNFSRNEKIEIINRDLSGKNSFPSILLFKNGRYVTRACDPPPPERVNLYVDDFKKYYQE